jgi:RNA polymerase sigma-70 factor (ECF subfamily)
MTTGWFQETDVFAKPQADLPPLTLRAVEGSARGVLRASGSAIGDCGLDKLKGQDFDAFFAALVEEHQPVVLGLCRSMGLRGADVEEAACDVFANVFRSLPAFDGRAALGTWIYRIAFRTILKSRAKRPRAPSSDRLHHQVDAGSHPPDAAIQAAELSQRIWDAVARLEPRQALVVEMYYRRDWPLQKIADLLEIPVGTVKTLLFRAREQLRKVFEREEIGL